MNYLNKNHIKFTVFFFNETRIKKYIYTCTPFDTSRLLTLTFNNAFHKTTNKMFKVCTQYWLYSLDYAWFHRRFSLKYIISQTWQQIQHCQYDGRVGESWKTISALAYRPLVWELTIHVSMCVCTWIHTRFVGGVFRWGLCCSFL